MLYTFFMPKSLFIDPSETLRRGEIKFNTIPVNAYGRDFNEELDSFGCDALIGILSDMCKIREFEEGIAKVKNGEGYRGITRKFRGPAHLSVGQEAAAVGQAFCLDKDDLSFGTHRAHAELLARGVKAVRTYPEAELERIMKNTCRGETLKAVEKFNKSGDVRSVAEDFLLFGALSEIFVKRTGFQRGMAGSMHAFFTPFGVYPNNAIVGASAPIAVGAALYKRANKENGIVVANVGDGAIGCGVVYESMNFASMDQFNGLWKKKGGLPIIFSISDNGYGMGGQTRGETMAFDMPARLGAGITPSEMYAERINGNDPLAVIDAYKRKKSLIETGNAPVLLDVVTYRLEGHSVSDNMSYREEKEIAAWRKADPIKLFFDKLEKGSVIDEKEYSSLRINISEKIGNIFDYVASDTETPMFSLSEAKAMYADVLFDKATKNAIFPNVKLPDDNLRVKEIVGKTRKDITMRDALFESVAVNMLADKSLIVYGEEVRDWGGISGVYRGLSEIFPYERLFNAPISEATIISSAIGYVLAGGKALVEIMFADFLARAADELINQLAKWRSISGGELNLPVVVRVAVGAKYGSQHSQDLSSLFAGIPGLKVVYAATPYDAKGLLNSALHDGNPVIFFENQRLYGIKEAFHEGGVPEGYYETELGLPDVKRQGRDVTIITVGSALYTAKAAAEALENSGISVEIIDIRTLSPLKTDIIIDSVNKTGRVVFLSDSTVRGSILNSVSVEITEKCFKNLKKPPLVLGASETVAPPCDYDDIYFVTADELKNAVSALCEKN